MGFKDRLGEYRKGLNLNKREMASKLEITETYYNMIENGKREPSKKFLITLVTHSNKPEEYWLYGVSTEDYLKTRDIVKSTRYAIDQISEMKLLDNVDSLFAGYEPKNITETLLIAALKSDLSYIIKREKE